MGVLRFAENWTICKVTTETPPECSAKFRQIARFVFCVTFCPSIVPLGKWREFATLSTKDQRQTRYFTEILQKIYGKCCGNFTEKFTENVTEKSVNFDKLLLLGELPPPQIPRGRWGLRPQTPDGEISAELLTEFSAVKSGGIFDGILAVKSGVAEILAEMSAVKWHYAAEFWP